MAQTRETYHFIHNVFGHFFKDMLDYFSTTLYPRFEYRVVGTYDKAVEYLAKRAQYDRETDQPLLPALVLNPSGEFSPAEGSAGGKQLWRFPNLAPSMIKRIFDPIYQDDNLIMHAGFIRIKGEFELIMLLNSFYEYCDLRLLMINYFGGMDRIIYPQFFSSFIILPDSFISYEYNNEYTGLRYNIDWSTADASNKLVRSTAINELVLPLNIKPQISLVNLADASNRYGGPDKIAEWRLTATINYELEMPNYLILESDYLAENIHLEMRYGSAYSIYNDYQPPTNRQIYGYHWDWQLDATSNNDIQYLDPSDATSEIDNLGDYVYKTRYFHEVTAADAAQETYLDIPIPEQITNRLMLIVNSKLGALNYGDHFLIIDNGNTLRIKREHVQLEAGWFIELFVYEDLNSISSSSSSSSLSSSSSSSSSSISSSSSSVSSSSSSGSSSSSSASLTTSSFTITAGIDDGYTGAGGAGWEPNLVTVQMGYAAFATYTWLRWIIDIPKDSIITNAYIKFYATNSTANAGCVLDFYFEDVDDAAQITDHDDYFTRSKSAALNWIPPVWISTNYYNSPDLSSILQPIVNRSGWNSGQHVQVFVYTAGGGNQSSRILSSYESASPEAEIFITYV